MVVCFVTIPLRRIGLCSHAGAGAGAGAGAHTHTQAWPQCLDTHELHAMAKAQKTNLSLRAATVYELCKSLVMSLVVPFLVL